MTSPAELPQLPDPGQVITAEREIRGSRRDFSGYEFDLEYTPAGTRYTARRHGSGPGPWLLITKDPGELRSELAGPETPDQRGPGIYEPD